MINQEEKCAEKDNHLKKTFLKSHNLEKCLKKKSTSLNVKNVFEKNPMFCDGIKHRLSLYLPPTPPHTSLPVLCVY